MYNGTLDAKRNSKYNNITIYRDEFGIPHIKANTFIAGIYGSGVVNAQDRLWQMHMKRRLASGRMSELGGKDTLELDKFFRSVGINRYGDIQSENIKNETELIDAYCDGINDVVDSMMFLPFEFWITWQKFEPWTRNDIFKVNMMMNLFLAFDFMFEPFKDLVRNKYGEEFALEVYSAKSQYMIDETVILDDEDLKKSNIYHQFNPNQTKYSHDFEIPDYLYDQLGELTKLEAMNNAYLGIGMKGSNNWVVNGSFTRSGKPILSNDPHLENMVPSTWYQYEIMYQQNGTDKFVIGIGVPGLPGIIIGRNNYAAWGVTNNLADTTDLYLEEFDENDNYLVDGKWIQMRKYEELIKIKGQQDYTLYTYETHHGSVLQNLFDLGNHLKPHTHLKGLSLCWPALKSRDSSYASIFGYMQAESLEQFVSALNLFNGPVINFIYATVDGDIGYQSLGRLPIKNNPENVFIQDGRTSYNDWVRYYNETETPRVINPAKGFIVTANNKIASNNLIGGISMNQVTFCRATKITEYIRNFSRKFDVQDMIDLQLTTHDLYCQKTHSSFIKIIDNYVNEFSNINRQKLQIVRDIFFNWTCHMDSNGPQSIGASIFGIFEQKILLKLFTNVSNNDNFNSRAVLNLVFDSFFFQRIIKWSEGQKLDEDFCKNKDTILTTKPCIYNILKAFEETYDMLDTMHGNNATLWEWGNTIRHVFVHLPFSTTILKYLFERSIQGYGNRRTIKLGGINLVKDQWKSAFGQNFKMVVSLSDEEKSYYVLDTGISENLFSPHFSDQMDMFGKGQYIEMQWGTKHIPSYKNVLLVTKNQDKKQEI